MTRVAPTERLRVDPPAVPVDHAFIAVLAAHAAASRPTAPARRVRTRLAVVLVAAAVAVTTLSAAWAARELATTRPPAPATHERRVEPVPSPVPSPVRARKAPHTTVEARPGTQAPAWRHPRPAGRPTVPVTAPTGHSTHPRSAPPVAPSPRRTHDADEPRRRADDRDGQATGTHEDGTDDTTDDTTQTGSDGGTEHSDGPTDDASDPTPSRTDGPDDGSTRADVAGSD